MAGPQVSKRSILETVKWFSQEIASNQQKKKCINVEVLFKSCLAQSLAFFLKWFSTGFLCCISLIIVDLFIVIPLPRNAYWWLLLYLCCVVFSLCISRSSFYIPDANLVSVIDVPNISSQDMACHLTFF